MPFLFFSPAALARTSNTMLYNSGKSRHPYLVPDPRGKVCSLSPLSTMIVVGFSEVPFIVLRKFLSKHSFLHVVIMKGYWILQHAFSMSIELIIQSFPPCSSNMFYIDFSCVDMLLHSWDKSHLDMGTILLICCWIQFVSILLRTFASIGQRILVCGFLVMSLSDFGISIMLAL